MLTVSAVENNPQKSSKSSVKSMDLDAVKSSLEPAVGTETLPFAHLPKRFYDSFLLRGLHVDLIQPDRIVCSISVPPRFVNFRGLLHSGMIAAMVDVVSSAVLFREDSQTSGVSVEISFSHIDAASVNEEIEVDARILSFVNSIGISTVEIRNKKTQKVIAQARHSKYLAVSSKL